MKALNVATISDNKIFIIIKICQISIKLKNTVFKNFTKIISKENIDNDKAAIQDLHKAIWYINDKIKMLENEIDKA